MGRPATINENDLLNRLAAVFKKVGYAGATLAILSEATGLKRASLYHRFPGGKEQMAMEVLETTRVWLGENILGVLSGSDTPANRTKQAANNFRDFYDDGRNSCLLNVMSSSAFEESPFSKAICEDFNALFQAFAKVSNDAGLANNEASERAMKAMIMLQGSLVISKGTSSLQPFDIFIQYLTEDLISK